MRVVLYLLICSVICLSFGEKTSEGIVLFNNKNDSDYIKWSKDYKLTYADFQAKVKDTISTAKYEKEGKVHAYSAVSINYTVDTKGPLFVVKANGLFNKKRSWADATDGKTLKHEQCHFDIAELYARRFEQVMKNYQNKNDVTIMNTMLQQYELIFDEYMKAQEAYDDACYSDGGEILYQEKVRKELEATEIK